MEPRSMMSRDTGEVALERLRSAEPPLFLSPSSELSDSARTASRYLFSSLLTYCTKPPSDALLAGKDFDAEQIWSQIELLSRPMLSSLRRNIRRLEDVTPPVNLAQVKEIYGEEEEIKEDDGEDDKEDEDDEDGEEEKDGKQKDDDDDDDEEEDDDDDDDDGDDEEDEHDEGGEKMNGVEDRFLKIKELEKYLKDDEAREYGLQENGSAKGKAGTYVRDKNGGTDEGDEEDAEDDEKFGNLDIDDDEDAEDERYEDFFGGKMKRHEKRKDSIKDKEGSDKSKRLLGEEENDIMDSDSQDPRNLSTHEKELLKIHSKIKEMEKANLEPKMWTMQGEVTANKRPKNSALEVDLDFEHNIRPPPAITVEVTASIEDIIKRRIIEGRFDDVQRAPDLRPKAPKEFKEMDETKSKKGLSEIYEEEYAQKTGLATTFSSSDEKKKEASALFKRLCLKLDALSHFHFAPKPVIEEMSIQANVPALVMEEIAPVAVSDAAMLAPEEVFQGKGDVKEEAELTRSDRKRRRANKKRRFKAEQSKREARKTRQKTGQDLQQNVP